MLSCRACCEWRKNNYYFFTWAVPPTAGGVVQIMEVKEIHCVYCRVTSVVRQQAAMNNNKTTQRKKRRREKEEGERRKDEEGGGDNGKERFLPGTPLNIQTSSVCDMLPPDTLTFVPPSSVPSFSCGSITKHQQQRRAQQQTTAIATAVTTTGHNRSPIPFVGKIELMEGSPSTSQFSPIQGGGQ